MPTLTKKMGTKRKRTGDFLCDDPKSKKPFLQQVGTGTKRKCTSGFQCDEPISKKPVKPLPQQNVCDSDCYVTGATGDVIVGDTIEQDVVYKFYTVNQDWCLCHVESRV